MPTIVHFEIPSDDIERAKKFYNDLFGMDEEQSEITVCWTDAASGRREKR